MTVAKIHLDSVMFNSATEPRVAHRMHGSTLARSAVRVAKFGCRLDSCPATA